MDMLVIDSVVGPEGQLQEPGKPGLDPDRPGKRFCPMFRFYTPKPGVFDGSW